MSIRKIKRHRLALQCLRVAMRKLLRGFQCEAVTLPQADGTVKLQLKVVLGDGSA